MNILETARFKLEGKNHLGDLGIAGIILKWILEKQDGMAWTALIWIKKQTSGGGLL